MHTTLWTMCQTCCVGHMRQEMHRPNPSWRHRGLVRFQNEQIGRSTKVAVLLSFHSVLRLSDLLVCTRKLYTGVLTDTMLVHRPVAYICTNTVSATELPSIRTPERLSPSNQSTLLPSFSSLQRSADRDDSSKTAPETVSKPVSPTCRGCVDKKSAIDDIALAVTGLDETVQMYGRRYRDHVCRLTQKIQATSDDFCRDQNAHETAH